MLPAFRRPCCGPRGIQKLLPQTGFDRTAYDFDYWDHLAEIGEAIVALPEDISYNPLTTFFVVGVRKLRIPLPHLQWEANLCASVISLLHFT